ncbi:uncharacterized protein LOC126266349 [Aethina tumida]|uniref:uncharacterized protein LOC126266349 n=1 Tax=Aethina tumida TaxID=116153 RepID=UPI002147C325|nr:uncharacterized protein LOC126266349 [Aethina tumida]
MMKRGLKMARKAQKAEEEVTCGKMATIIIKEREEMLKGMAAVQTEEEEDDVLVEMLTVATNLITVTKDGEKMTKKAKEAKEKMTTGKVETTIREIGIPLNTEGAVVIVEAVATDLIMMKRALKMARKAQEAVQEVATIKPEVAAEWTTAGVEEATVLGVKTIREGVVATWATPTEEVALILTQTIPVRRNRGRFTCPWKGSERMISSQPPLLRV